MLNFDFPFDDDLEEDVKFYGMFDDSESSGHNAISVEALTKQIKELFNVSFGKLYVVGEVSGWSVVRSGHAYFTLKDEKAQLPSVMWASTLRRNAFVPQNGMKVLCEGKLEVYEPQGKYQLIVSKIEQIGVGWWQKRFKELQEKLGKRGLFAPARKKPLPLFIKRVGVVTSPTGAALRDFVNTLGDFSRGIEVVVAPTRVQGSGACEEIAAALRLLNDAAAELRLDAIALIRGGGSVEDLWEFNEEAAVCAVAESRIPVVTGIGHEIDTSLCDLAADVMAVTPTAAAGEIAFQDSECFRDLEAWEEKMRRQIEIRCRHARERLGSLEKHAIFQEPGRIIGQRKTDLLDQMDRRLSAGMSAVYNRHESRFRETVGRLEAMSPLAVLSRGFSITKACDSGKILRNATDVRYGERIETRLEEGTFFSVVVEVGSGR